MESKLLCCLRRVGENPPAKHILIPLDGKTEVTLGRSLDCSVCLGLNSKAPMISRKHAILSKEADSWNIMDNKSSNGVYLNGKRLQPLKPYTLTEKDTVQLGIPVHPGTQAEYVWTFHTALKVKKASNKPLLGANSSTTGAIDLPEVSHQKRKGDEDVSSSSSPSKRRKQNNEGDLSLRAEYKKKMEEVQKEAEEKLKDQEKHLEEMRKLLAEKERAQEQMFEQLQTRERELQEEIQQKQAQHEKEQKEKEAELKKQYESQLQEREQLLIGRLTSEKKKLEEERQQLELQLATEMEQQIGERNQELQAELLEQTSKLTAIIQQKDAEQKLLQTQLDETRTEQMKAAEGALGARDDILQNFANLMETELQCAICNELFIQATSLNCSHSFCALCIEQWMEVKRECPVCRKAITSHLRSIVLDNYIDKMLEHFSDDMKEVRKDLVRDRKEMQANREAEKVLMQKAGQAAVGVRLLSGGRRRGRGRGRRRGAVNQTAAATTSTGTTTRAAAAGLAPATTTSVLGRRSTRPIVLSDSDSDEEEEEERVDYSPLGTSSESDTSVDGIDGAYYGGYGHCYNCGRRGHWATGCPF